MVQITTAASVLIATAAIAPVLALPVSHVERGLESSCVIRPYLSQNLITVSLSHKHLSESHHSQGRHVESEGHETEEELSAHLEP